MDGKAVVLDILMNQLERAHYNLDKTKVYGRCPYCGDSRSNRSETNFNIRIPTDDDPRWLYICFRASCGQHGAITPEFLRMIGSDRHDANVYLNRINATARKAKRFKEKGRKAFVNFLSPNDKLSLAKLDYINGRLGTKLSLVDLMKLKIHTSLNMLLKSNEVVIPVKKERYYNDLSLYGICFISAYGDYVVVRNTTKSKKIGRYTMIDVFEGDMVDGEKFKFYIIPTKIDLMSPRPTVINMAEGGFDILSVYLNIEPRLSYENQIHVSVSGSSYERALIQLIRQYGLVDIAINFFSDDNIQLDVYQKICNRVRPYTNSLDARVIYNDLNDDFGVPKSQIKIREIYLT